MAKKDNQLQQLPDASTGNVVLSAQELYSVTFKGYPDVLDVQQVSTILGVSTKTVYRLLREGTLNSLKVGREFRIPKVFVLKYLKVFVSQVCER